MSAFHLLFIIIILFVLFGSGLRRIFHRSLCSVELNNKWFIIILCESIYFVIWFSFFFSCAQTHFSFHNNLREHGMLFETTIPFTMYISLVFSHCIIIKYNSVFDSLENVLQFLAFKERSEFSEIPGFRMVFD